MANEKNLKPNSARTPSERRENATKAGIASGIARRKKRDARKAAQIILNLPAQGAIRDNLAALGVEDEDLTNMMALMGRMFMKAQAGDVNAARFLVDMSGGGARYELDKKEISIEQKRLDFEKQKYKDQIEGTGASSTVDDWVDAVIQANESEEQKK